MPPDHRNTNFILSEHLDLLPQTEGPWVIIGDFNLICSPDEKNSNNITYSLINTFNDAIL